MTATTGPPLPLPGETWPGRAVADNATHAVRADVDRPDSTGLASRCGLRGRGVEWSEAPAPDAPVTCGECRALGLADAVRAAAHDYRAARWSVTTALLLEVGHEVYETVLRSRMWSRYGGSPHPDGRYRLFGMPMVPTNGLPPNGWRVLELAAAGTS